MVKFSTFPRIFSLANILHKCYEPNTANTSDSDTKKPKNSAVLDPKGLILPIFGLVVAIGLFVLTYKFADLISAFGGASALLPTVFLAGGISAFFFSFIELINTLYMSSDLSAIIIFPFSSLEIVCARLLGCLRTVFPIGAIVTLPACLGFGFGASLDPLYYIVSILGTILVPFFSLFVAASVIIFIMSFVRILRNKDAATIAGVILAVALIVFSGTFNSTSSEIGNFFLQNLQNIANFSIIVPIAPLLTNFYSTGNFFFLLAVIGIFAIIIGIFILFTNLFYLKGALNVRSGSSHVKNVSLNKTSSKSVSASRAIIKKEFRTIFRTPAFYANGWVLSTIWPILFALPIISNHASITSLINAAKEVMNNTENVSTIIPYSLTVACLFAFIASFFACMLNNLSYNAISREGSTLALLKTHPVDSLTQLRSKRYAAIIVTLIGSTPLSLGAGIFAAILGLIPFYGIILMLLVNLATVLLLNTIQLYLGSRHPNLDWTNIAIIGKNSSVVFILSGFGVLFVLPTLSVLGLMFIPPLIVLSVYILVIPIFSFFFSRHLLSRSAKNLDNC